MLDLAIVIVSYNVKTLLKNCLRSVLAAQGALKMAVCVVDNNSSDDSVAMVHADFPQITLIENHDNPGYSAANNQGLIELGIHSHQPPRYALLLNPDTEVEPGTFTDAVHFMDNNPNVGIMGPKLLLPNGQLDIACRRSFPTPAVSFYRMTGLGKLFPKSKRFASYNLTWMDIDQQADVDAVVGAFMLLRTEAVQQVGLLDEQFWMYGEDLDWAKRIKDAGWRVVYNPQVRTLHVKRASSRQNKRAQVEFYRAMLIFYYKHYRQQTALPVHGIVLLGIAFKGGRTIWPEISKGADILTAAS